MLQSQVGLNWVGYRSETNISISMFILNEYGYKSNMECMNINMDLNRIIKLNDYRIKEITK